MKTGAIGPDSPLLDSISMTAHVASSADRVPYSGVRAIAELAMGMDDVLRLYFGESSLPTPDAIKRAAADALAEIGRTHV